MSPEKHVEGEENPQDNTLDSQGSATLSSISAESGIIISTHQIQSIEISDKFTRQKTSDGWYITLHRPCKITINLTASMRKIEVPVLDGDIIENDGTDLVILRKHTSEVYKSQRPGTSLARNRDELLQGGTTAV